MQERATEILVGMLCSVVAGAGVILLAFGFALVAASIWVMEKMED